ncbi:hypothetical protein QYF36_019581 [Acer negundo]|nr:hypothetical protein QYF36_019581 [Acer negundo]
MNKSFKNNNNNNKNIALPFQSHQNLKLALEERRNLWGLKLAELKIQVMEANKMHTEHEEDEEEFVLLDIDVLYEKFDIPPNAPYTLTDLDTLNPILIIDGKLKLIGEYEETIGTCFVFSEDEAAQTVHDERGPSEANLPQGKSTIHPKQVKPVGRLNKILKFRILLDDEVVDATTEQFQDQTTEPTN